MQYKFYEYEFEPEPQPSGGRAGNPPGKQTAIGLLDGPVPTESARRALLIRIAAALILAAVAAGTLLLIFGR